MTLLLSSGGKDAIAQMSLQFPEFRYFSSSKPGSDLQRKRWQNAAGVLNIVDDQARRKVIDALEQAFKLAGAESLEDAAAIMQQIADFFAHRVKPLLNREQLDALLQQSELSSENEQMLITMVENLPSLVVVGLNMLSSEAAKSFPVANTGSPKSLTSENRRAVCEYIGKLHSQGTDLKVAKERTAQKFSVSLSTVERTWAERKKGHKPSLNEMIDFLKSPNK